MKQTIIILGGNSPRNATWVEQLTAGLRQHANVHAHTYRHWDHTEDEINFEDELASLNTYLHANEGDYYIVAKSAGALLALQGIAAGKLTPKALVCVGLPLAYAEHRHVPLKKTIASNTLPTLYIQATQDPAGNSHDVSMLTAQHGKFISVKGNSHDYDNITKLISLAMQFINSH